MPSYHIVPPHITSYDFITRHIIPYHIISYHAISYHITSYHAMSIYTMNVSVEVHSKRSCIQLKPDFLHFEVTRILVSNPWCNRYLLRGHRYSALFEALVVEGSELRHLPRKEGSEVLKTITMRTRTGCEEHACRPRQGSSFQFAKGPYYTYMRVYMYACLSVCLCIYNYVCIMSMKK